MIKSKFYLIRGDGEPIYVGFTNRTIRQRFLEHRAGKNFSDYDEITIEKLAELDYEFTWDEDILYENANEVSSYEARLVLEYGTQDGKFQKAIGGGQVWSYEKWFVRTNKDNPKFVGMSGTQIELWLDEEKEIDVYLKNFVNHMLDPVEVYLRDFVGGMKGQVDRYLSSFVKTMKDPVEVHMIHFVGGMLDPVDVYLSNFVGGMLDPVDVYLKSFVNNMKDSVDQYLINFVGNMKK